MKLSEMAELLQTALDSENWAMVREVVQLLLDYDEFEYSNGTLE